MIKNKDPPRENYPFPDGTPRVRTALKGPSTVRRHGREEYLAPKKYF
jgi:hypothetical protein